MTAGRPDVRAVLLAELAAVGPIDVAVMLSGGIDSAACLFALLELGKRPVAYSFMLDGRLSTDFTRAQRNAATFGVPFRPVLLPADLPTLQADLRKARWLGCRKKTEFECVWPFLHAFAAVAEPAIVAGHGADGHFCISKKGMMHWRDRIDQFRAGLFGKPGYAQGPILRRLGAESGATVHLPFLARSMVDAFRGTTWEQVNRPRQKQPILDGWPDRFARMRVAPHTNLQLGDSGIADHFGILLRSGWNRRAAKSVVAIYNDLAAGRL